VTGLAHAWFGGPGCAESSKKHEFEARVFLRHPDMRIVRTLHAKGKPAVERRTTTSRPNVPARSRQKAKEPMKLNNLAKTVVLGLAVLLASSAFASNKSTVATPRVVRSQRTATFSRRVSSPLGRHWIERRSKFHASRKRLPRLGQKSSPSTRPTTTTRQSFNTTAAKQRF